MARLYVFGRLFERNEEIQTKVMKIWNDFSKKWKNILTKWNVGGILKGKEFCRYREVVYEEGTAS